MPTNYTAPATPEEYAALTTTGSSRKFNEGFARAFLKHALLDMIHIMPDYRLQEIISLGMTITQEWEKAQDDETKALIEKMNRRRTDFSYLHE